MDEPLHQALDEAVRAARALRVARDEEALRQLQAAVRRVHRRLSALPDQARDPRLTRLEDHLRDLADLHLLAARAGRDRALASLSGALLDKRHRRLNAAWRAFARQPHAPAPPDTEVERKYLLRALPPHARQGQAQELWQGYLPGEKLQERLRRVKDGRGVRHYRTVKLGRGLSRVEVEEETFAWLFRRLWPLTAGKRVKKRRWVVEAGPFTWEVDAFLDRELVLAEVELPSEAAVAPLPAWLAPYVVREVTDEDRYVNINLAR